MAFTSTYKPGIILPTIKEMNQETIIKIRCDKCYKVEYFYDENRGYAIKKALKAGWQITLSEHCTCSNCHNKTSLDSAKL
jgi:hypothetical protein